MNFRYDNRSEEEFKADIKSRTLEERSLFELWLDFVEREKGIRPKFEDTGCGKEGDFLETDKVSMAPDFKVEGYGEVEIKFSKNTLKGFFHLKSNQVKHYFERNATILMIMGSQEENPQFTMLTPKALAKIIDKCKVIPWVGFGGKMSYKVPINMFAWRDLK